MPFDEDPEQEEYYNQIALALANGDLHGRPRDDDSWEFSDQPFEPPAPEEPDLEQQEEADFEASIAHLSSREQQRQRRLRSQVVQETLARKAAAGAESTSPFTILNPEIPVVSPFLREEVRPRVREAGEFVGELATERGASMLTGGPVVDIASKLGAEELPVVGKALTERREFIQGAGDVGEAVGGFVGDVVVPEGGFDIALTAIPAFAGFRRGMVAGEGIRRAGLRGILEGIALDPTNPNVLDKARLAKRAGVLEQAITTGTGRGLEDLEPVQRELFELEKRLSDITTNREVARSLDEATSIQERLNTLRAQVDDNIVDSEDAFRLHSVNEGVKNAKPDDLVTVYHGTDEASALSISKNGFIKGGYVTTDPEVAHIFSKVTGRLGGGDPEVVVLQVPRRLLQESKENPAFFTLREGGIRPIVNSASDGFVANAGKVIREWLHGEGGLAGERGSFEPRFGGDEVPEDVAKTAFGGPGGLDDLTDEGVLFQVSDRTSQARHHEGYGGFRKQGDPIEPFTVSPAYADVEGPPWNFNEDAIRETFERERKKAMDADDRLAALQEKPNESSEYADAIFEARKEMYDSLHWMQRFGEALYRMTGGKEGLPQKMRRAIDTFIASEEGAVHIPSGPNLGGQGYTTKYRPVPEVVAATGVRPILPRLTPSEWAFNHLKSIANPFLGRFSMTPGDPFGTRLVDEDIHVRARQEASRKIVRDSAEAYRHDAFKFEKDGLTVKGLNATVSDIAADWQSFKPILTPDQNAALAAMRDALETRMAALRALGIEIEPRADLRPGGFFLPRGNTLEDGFKYEIRTKPIKRAARINKNQVKWDTQVQGIKAGEEYFPFPDAMDTYLRNVDGQIMDAHWTNVLRNASDAAGEPLVSTAEARLLAQNAGIKRQVESLRSKIASLTKSVEGLDNRIHAKLLNFLYSPAPDLSELNNAINALSTRGGALRQRPAFLPGGDPQLNWKIIRKMVREEVQVNRGRYAGMTRQQAEKVAFREWQDAQKVRQGRFKGLTFEQGKTQLDAIKVQLKGLEKPWEAAKKKAQLAPEGYSRVEPYNFGVNLQNGAYVEDAVAGVIDDYLKALGPPRGKGSSVWEMLMAAKGTLSGLRLSFDFGSLGIQGLIPFWENTGSHMRGSVAAFKSMRDERVMGRYINWFDQRARLYGRPTADEWAAQHGLQYGGVETEMQVGREGLLKKYAGPFDRFFGSSADAWRLDGADSALEGWAKDHPQAGLAERRKAAGEIAAAWNGMTGWSLRKFGGAVGEALLLAPRFYTSQLENIGRAVAGKGMSRTVARRALFKTLGGGVIFTALANEALGNDLGDESFNWWSPTVNDRVNRNFLRIRAGKVDLSVFGYLDSLAYGIAGTLSGDETMLLRARSQPVVGAIWDLLSGEDAIGRPVTGWSILRSFAPISLQQAASEPLTGTIAGTAGIKASGMSTSEQRDALTRQVIDEIGDSEVLPEWLRGTFKQLDPKALSQAEHKLVADYIKTNYPEQEKEYREARREAGSVYQVVADRADDRRTKYAEDYDKLLALLKAGTPPREVWTDYDKARNQLAGALEEIYGGTSKESKEYQEAVADLPTNDIRRWEAAYNQILQDNKKGPNTFDWDLIEEKRKDLVRDLHQADPDLARRFVYSLTLHEQQSRDSAHPLVQLKKTASKQLQPLYDMRARDAEDDEVKQWLNSNPLADQLNFLTSQSVAPTVHSVAAAETLLERFPNFGTSEAGIRLSGSTLKVTPENLTTLKQYDKEITQLLTLPGTARGRDGRDYSPRSRLRQQDALYDALYFWLGFSKPAKDETSVPVYHGKAVLEYLKLWGPRSDDVKPRQAQ